MQFPWNPHHEGGRIHKVKKIKKGLTNLNPFDIINTVKGKQNKKERWYKMSLNEMMNCGATLEELLAECGVTPEEFHEGEDEV